MWEIYTIILVSSKYSHAILAVTSVEVETAKFYLLFPQWGSSWSHFTLYSALFLFVP